MLRFDLDYKGWGHELPQIWKNKRLFDIDKSSGDIVNLQEVYL